MSTLITDTPFKQSYPVSATNQRSMAADELRKVENELRNILYVVNSDDFFQYLLPFKNGDIQKIQNQLEKTRIYDGQRWTAFRKKPANETDLYKAFVDIANEVNKLANSCRQKGAMEGMWVDCHHKPPNSPDRRAAAVRPDVAFVSTYTQVSSLQTNNTHVDRLEETLSTLRPNRSDNSEYSEVRYFAIWQYSY
jgi:hypothetical protein